MKRFWGTILAVALAGAVLAQAPFTIVRPVDGSKVREKIRVLVPENSIPDRGYVGVYVNGKFVEATVFDKKDGYFEYILDTKERKIADGKTQLALVLFQDQGERSVVLERSSVEVTVANSTSIDVPDDGFSLRYKFKQGKELIYNVEVAGTLSSISEAQARMGGRAAELPVESDKFRLLYAIDNVLPDGKGLVRVQALPDPGKNYAHFTLLENAAGEVLEGARYYDWQMHPLYMAINPTGSEEFGFVPLYVPIEGSLGDPARTDLYVLIPLPTLPTKSVKPGDFWASSFQLPTLDLDRWYELKSLVAKLPARGELLGMEWEMGHPCAKIRTSVAQASVPSPGQGKDGQAALGGERVSVEQTTWFALDLGVPVKFVWDLTADTRQQSQGTSAQPGGGTRGAPMSGGGGQRSDDEGGRMSGTQGIGQAGTMGPPGAGRGGRGGQGIMGPPAATGRGGAQGGGARGGTELLRFRYRIVLTLES